ncbi:hypothetical protein Pfo_012639 [Paulownia fortunei]|nr:hypothetical protein Pfo_012639 [Paulownia fortunei]
MLDQIWLLLEENLLMDVESKLTQIITWRMSLRAVELKLLESMWMKANNSFLAMFTPLLIFSPFGFGHTANGKICDNQNFDALLKVHSRENTVQDSSLTPFLIFINRNGICQSAVLNIQIVFVGAVVSVGAGSGAAFRQGGPRNPQVDGPALTFSVTA